MHVSAWDGVLARTACASLQASTLAVGLGHRVFRPAAPPRTRLEAALGSVLRELNDSATHVEYWTRQPWTHVELHADVDEKLAAATGQLIYPEHAHVLYLAVGTRVRGPTCVFDAVRGSDLAAWRTTAGAHLEAAAHSLTIVPAVRGRLLRFNGSLLHAVPAPTDRWLTPFAKTTPTTPEAEWQRAVVLFNTWPTTPPLGVETEPPAGDAPAVVGEALSEAFSSWREVHVGHMAGRSSGEAEGGTCDAGSGSGEVAAKVWLLGDENRRGQASRTVQLGAPAAIGDALAQEAAATRLTLRAI